jgi:hypothetical protein
MQQRFDTSHYIGPASPIYTYPELQFQTPRINIKAELLVNQFATVYGLETITPKVAAAARRYDGNIELGMNGAPLDKYAIAIKYSKYVTSVDLNDAN